MESGEPLDEIAWEARMQTMLREALARTDTAELTQELQEINARLAAEIAERQRAERARRDLMRRLVTAQEEERRRLSRELHDQMGQYLTAFSLGLKMLEDAYPAPPDARSLLTRLRGILEELGREVHRIAVELRPTALDDLGLAAALKGYIETWAERTGVSIEFHTTGEERGRLPSAIETTLYRVVQEALNNTAKHAQASQVSVLLSRATDHVLLIVEDNGVGFDPDGVATSSTTRPSMGLLGMEERVMSTGGKLTIESWPGGDGTTLFVRIPLNVDGKGEKGEQDDDNHSADE
jgi:signal transduction histidine kinase